MHSFRLRQKLLHYMFGDALDYLSFNIRFDYYRIIIKKGARDADSLIVLGVVSRKLYLLQPSSVRYLTSS